MNPRTLPGYGSGQGHQKWYSKLGKCQTNNVANLVRIVDITCRELSLREATKQNLAAFDL